MSLLYNLVLAAALYLLAAHLAPDWTWQLFGLLWLSNLLGFAERALREH